MCATSIDSGLWKCNKWQCCYTAWNGMVLQWRIAEGMLWAATSENVLEDMCAQRSFRSTCAFAQSDQNLHQVLFGKPRMQSFLTRTMKALNKLRRIFASWFESSLGARQKVRFLTLQRYFIKWANSDYITQVCTLMQESTLYEYCAGYCLAEVQNGLLGKDGYNVTKGTFAYKGMTLQVGRLSQTQSWENGPE